MFFGELIFNLSGKESLPVELENFWASSGLSVRPPLDKALLLLNDRNVPVASAALYRNIAKGISIREDYRGENITGRLLTWILQELEQKGIFNILVYTKPENEPLFSPYSFTRIAATDSVVLLERGKPGLNDFIATLDAAAEPYKGKNNGIIIVNCNPMTNGHLFLIETAASQCDHLFVLVLEEDRSLFPFKTRLDLVRKATAGIANVTVLPSSQYVISSATFPDYFLKGLDREAVYAGLDIAIFSGIIAPHLSAIHRFVGDEPYCEVTNSYNEAMGRLLPSAGISFHVIARKESEGRAISASFVRELIRSDDYEAIRRIVPKPTYEFLMTDEGRNLTQKIKSSNSRH